MRFLQIFTLIMPLLLVGCYENQLINISEEFYTTEYHNAIKKVTDVIVHDIFSPPVATRIYAYTTIAGFETARFGDSTYLSLEAKIMHLTPIIFSEEYPHANTKISAVLAALLTGKYFIFSEDSIQNHIEYFKKSLKNTGFSKKTISESEKLAHEVSQQIIQWAKKDMYLQTRSYPKFSVTKEAYRWKPTPPGYMDAIEPAWSIIRPMILDSAAVFKPDPPTPYDMEKNNSTFYKEVMEVYNTTKSLTLEQKEIASFWDCNPFALQITGHVMHAVKKISPGGHWVNITGLAAKKSNLDFLSTARVYSVVSIGLFDAFISCWDEKYRSNLIRPESVINEYIDPEWLPLLQTPPFPEYTSGHSVASTASSVILTAIFGDDFAFDDDTEVEFGLPVRSFTSFYHAADEASISRLYGGIHYRPAIVNGIIQGRKVGELVVDRFLK